MFLSVQRKIQMSDSRLYFIFEAEILRHLLMIINKASVHFLPAQTLSALFCMFAFTFVKS